MMDRFLEVYARLDGDNLDLLADIYATDIHFIDPAHEITGLSELRAYFAKLYHNLQHIHFDYFDICSHNDSSHLLWRMSFGHPRIAGGRTVEVDGASFLRFNTEKKVFYHRDFFDLGALMYEHLPLVGTVIRGLKRRMVS